MQKCIEMAKAVEKNRMTREPQGTGDVKSLFEKLLYGRDRANALIAERLSAIESAQQLCRARKWCKHVRLSLTFLALSTKKLRVLSRQAT
jgi:hypothetical protein